MSQRVFNPKAFLKKTSPELVERFFGKHHLTPIFDPGRLEKDPWFHYWTSLPSGVRDPLEPHLRRVNDLCHDVARSYLEKAVEDRKAALEPVWSAIKTYSHHDLAMTLYLGHTEGFAWASNMFTIDTKERLKDYRGKYALPPLHASAERKEAFKQELKAFFLETFGGDGCAVEDYYAADKMILMVYHKYYPRPRRELDEQEQLVINMERPVEAIATVFYPDQQIFKVKAAKKNVREEIRDLFARIFAGDPDFFERENEVDLFDFDKLTEVGFKLTVLGSTMIESARVSGMTFNVPVKHDPLLTISLPEGCLLNGTLRTLGIEIEDLDIRGVKIQFKFKGGRKNNTRTAELSLPNNTNLSDSERDRTVRDLLRTWEIEIVRRPLEPAFQPPRALPRCEVHLP